MPNHRLQQTARRAGVKSTARNLKGDLAIRPIYHQLEHRVDAHIFVAFLSYCLHVTLRQLARTHTPRIAKVGLERNRRGGVKKSEGADLHEACGQDVLEESANKLHNVQADRAPARVRSRTRVPGLR